MEKKEWNPPHFMCVECRDEIWSKYPGEFVLCKCGSIFVDQTEYYSRYGGKPENFIEVNNVQSVA